MRSKPKARRSVAQQDGLEDMRLSADPDDYDDASDDFPIRPLIIAPSDALSDSGGAEPEVDDDEDEDEHPVYIPEDIHIPEGFELRESTVFAGLGVWTTSSAQKGEKFGPFEGKLRDSVDNPTAAWELVDEVGKVKGWIDASQPGTGNWLKYVRSCSDPARQNLMAVQLHDQVFYKAVRDIAASEELLLYEQDAVFQEPDGDNTPVNYQDEDRHFTCERCREVFRSKVALRRHETYVCNNKNAIFTTINRGFKDSMQQLQQRLQQRFQQQQEEQQQMQKQMHTNQFEEQDKQQQLQQQLLQQQLLQQGSTKGLEERERKDQNPSQPGQKPDQLKQELSANKVSDRQREVENSISGQSEEMIQTGAADDHSALGSPSADTQPYSIIDSVTGLRTFPCENCDKQFTDPSNLQRHIRSQHHGARSHACPECGKTFATSSGLKQHQHIHSSVKPFQCEVCLKAYTQFSNLCRHKRMHADCRQQIKCKDCGQAFSTMTSLSKHKRFCEGMLRPNGSQRIAYPGLAAAAAAVGDKSASGLSLMNAAAAAQNQTSALASAYMNVYGPRAPAFPFYPPFAGSGFPMFPAGHPMAGMAPPMMHSDGGKLGGGPVGGGGLLTGSGSSNPTSPGSAHSLHGQTGELKREKNASEGSEADSSDVSSASDLDTSTGSDVDSELGLGGRSKFDRGSALRAHLSGALPPHRGVQVINSHTRLAKSPLNSSAPPPAAHNLSLNSSSSSKDTPANSKHSEDEDGPFDLSKSSPSTPVSFATSGDQPLDLSVRAKDVAATPETTPRKTHIFGSGGGSGSSEGKRTPTSSLATPPTSTPSSSSITHHHRATSSPETPPSPVNITPSERGLHYAYPLSSPVVMEPMYRVDKEKPHSYQDVMARMMGFAPRLPLGGHHPHHPHHSPLTFPGLSAGGMGLLSPSRPDAAKLLPPMLGKGPEHFQYSSTVNKLKERYACKFCGKIFPRSANLTRHLRTHTGEQPYKCKYCERSFSISSNLQRHVRNIHNKEKPFKCPLCDRCFGQQTNLDRHLKKHESDDPTMLDSPLQPDHELEEKDESYFDEIRNFIGKATADGGSGSGGEEGGSVSAPSPAGSGINGIAASLLAAKESRNAAATSGSGRDSGLVDSAFSLTGQVVETPRSRSPPTSGHKRPADEDDDDLDDDLDDVVDDEEEDDDDVLSASAAKKARVDNNNDETLEDAKASNGFHQEDEEEGEQEGAEEEDPENSPSLSGLSEVKNMNGVNAPLVCSS